MSTYTYDETQIIASGTNYISVVRFLINDTLVSGGANTALVSDEVITALYLQQAGITVSQLERNWRTAIEVKRHICSNLSSSIQSFSSGGTSITYGNRSEQCKIELADLIMRLRELLGVAPILYPNRSASFRKDGW